MISRFIFAVVLAFPGCISAARGSDTDSSCYRVFEDRDGNGRQSPGERGLAGIRVSDGVELATTDTRGHFQLSPVPGRTLFVIKPAGFEAPRRTDELPGFRAHGPRATQQAPRDDNQSGKADACPRFGLRRAPRRVQPLDVLVFADPQPKSLQDVDYFDRDIVQPLLRSVSPKRPAADLGLSLGDIVNDDLSLLPAVAHVTAQLHTPWLYVAGNHDMDLGATRDEDALQSFRHQFGPDTFAWEEHAANFVVLDDVVYLPGQRPSYIGGLRDDQFTFLERYLRTADPRRLLVIAVHIPLFPDGGQTFRVADRLRLFALLKPFPKVLVLSGHGHVQRHVFHDASTGWTGAPPLHEYNVGAACGAFWSGVKDAEGIPDSTMADGTPNGYARMRVEPDGRYALSWHPARLRTEDASFTRTMALHAPRVLRHGAYPAWGVYANVFMAPPDACVEFRIDDGPWKPMSRVERADPRLVTENVRDDEATTLRGYDRSPEAQPSTHLWRGALPTDLPPGTHRIDVRAADTDPATLASTTYRLEEASP